MAGLLKNLFARAITPIEQSPAGILTGAIAVENLNPSGYNDSVHHEYFMDERTPDGWFPWRARVYGNDGQPTENAGSNATEAAAHAAAQAWCAIKKAELRGAP